MLGMTGAQTAVVLVVVAIVVAAIVINISGDIRRSRVARHTGENTSPVDTED